MSSQGILRLHFFDAYGNRLRDNVDIFLRHSSLPHRVEVREHRATRSLRIEDLKVTHGRSYRVLIYPSNYRIVSRYVQVEEKRENRQDLFLPINPDKVIEIEAPSYPDLSHELREVLENSTVEGFSQAGESLYGLLDPIRKAGLLNLYTKMSATTFDDGRPVFSFVRSLTRLRGDRVFAVVDRDLRDTAVNSLGYGLFREAPDTLHTPPPGFVRAGSYKTLEQYGNLQLTFFCRPDTLDFMIDADIDDAQGIEHVFQVLNNFVTQSFTHPYDIHEILLYHQKLDPGYRLSLG